MNVGELKREIIAAGRQACETGMASAAGGNIGMRLDDRYFITATNAPLRSLRPEDTALRRADDYAAAIRDILRLIKLAENFRR